MKKGIAVMLALADTGCAATAQMKQVTTPDGGQGFYISCDGSGYDWTGCYEQATKACNGKYTIIDKNETSTATPYGPLVRRNMIIDCKN